MRVQMHVPLRNIQNDKKPAFDAKTLKFVFALMRGDKFPPIPVARTAAGCYRLTGGRHRWSAHKLLGSRTVLCTVAIPQEPNPFKATVHGPDKPLRQSGETSHQEPTTWLHL